MSPFSYHRIVIIGSTGAGKSTLAEKLAGKFGYKSIELDALNWEPNWVSAPQDIFRARVEQAIQAKRWVVAGNYSSIRDLIWGKAELVIWLDYSFLLILRQLVTRTFKRWWYHEYLWGTNYENIWVHLKLWSEESLIHWLFKTYWRRKREFPILLALPEHGHLHTLRFQHPKDTDEWLGGL